MIRKDVVKLEVELFDHAALLRAGEAEGLLDSNFQTIPAGVTSLQSFILFEIENSSVRLKGRAAAPDQQRCGTF